MLKNKFESGFSLISVVITFGLIMIAANVFLVLWDTQVKETKAINQHLSKANLNNYLLTALQRGLLCNYLAGDKPLEFDSTQKTIPELTISKLYGSSFNGAPILASAGNGFGAGTDNLTIAPSGIKLKGIKNMGLPTVYTANLTLNYDQKSLVRSLTPIILSVVFDVDLTMPKQAKISQCFSGSANTGWTLIPPTDKGPFDMNCEWKFILSDGITDYHLFGSYMTANQISNTTSNCHVHIPSTAKDKFTTWGGPCGWTGFAVKAVFRKC